MKFNAAAAATAAAMLAGVAHADEVEASPAAVELPTFTVSLFLPNGNGRVDASDSWPNSPSLTNSLTLALSLAHHHQGGLSRTVYR